MDEPISAISWPTLEVDGVTYIVKFSQSAAYRLQKMHIDMNEIQSDLRSNADRTSPRFGKLNVSTVMDLLAAMIGRGFTGENLADLVDMNVAARVVLEALGKVPRPASTKLREPATEALPEVPPSVQ